MPLFNFDDAIKAVQTAISENTNINNNLANKKKALQSLKQIQKDVSKKINSSKGLSIEALDSARATLLTSTEELQALQDELQTIQTRINGLPKITSSVKEQNQLATQQRTHDQIEQLTGQLDDLQRYLNLKYLSSNVSFDQSNTFLALNTYNLMAAIVELEEHLTTNHSYDITGDLDDILRDSPVATLFNKSRTVFNGSDALIDSYEAQKQKNNISDELDLATLELNRLADSIDELEKTILIKNTIRKTDLKKESWLPQNRETLEQQKIARCQACNSARSEQSRSQAVISQFNIIPIATSEISEATLTAYNNNLKAELNTLSDNIETGFSEILALNLEATTCSKNLTNAVNELQDQYNQSALTLIALTTCAVVALVLLEVLTLPVAAPVLAVSLAAIGLWHYNQTTDPEALPNSTPAP